MSVSNHFNDENVISSEVKTQGLKHLPHWPPVNIDFEDVIYTVDEGMNGKST